MKYAIRLRRSSDDQEKNFLIKKDLTLASEEIINFSKNTIACYVCMINLENEEPLGAETTAAYQSVICNGKDLFTGNTAKNLFDNLTEIKKLLDLYSSNDTPERFKSPTTLKALLVLMVACWESFIEDLVEETFKQYIYTESASNIPKEIIKTICGKIKNHKNDYVRGC